MILGSIALLFLPNTTHAVQVRLAWDANTEPDVAGYKLYYGTASRRYSTVIDTGPATRRTVSDLVAGKTYYFAVTAYNTSGQESGYSNEVRYPVGKDSDGDGIPDDLETGVYGTDPDLADTDGDGIDDGQELALWGSSWNGDSDADGVINLLDWDSDGDGFSDGEEVAKGTDPGDKTSKVAALPMEAGEVTVDHQWKKVSFGRQFFKPAVVVGGMSANGSQAAVVRIRNVTGSGFEIRVQEWDCYDGVHAKETVGYLAVESGVHSLAGNLQVEAGQFMYSTHGEFASRRFQQAFPETPVVLAAVVTFNDPAAVTVRLDRIATNGLSIGLQEQEANLQDHGDETVAYIAWQPSSGSFDGIRFEVDQAAKAVDHRFMQVDFLEPHAAPPVFMAQMQSAYGGNTAGIQWRGKDAEGVKVRIAEETSRDRETKHVLEKMGFMVFSAAQ